MVMGSTLCNQASRRTARLEEGADDVEEFRDVEQECIVPLVGLDFRERYPCSAGVERMHGRA